MRRYLLPSLLAIFLCHDASAAERPRSKKNQIENQEFRKKKRRKKKVRYLPMFRVLGEGGYVGYSVTPDPAAAKKTKTATAATDQITAWHGALVTQGVFAFTPKFAAVAGLGGGLFYKTVAAGTANQSTMVWLLQPELGLEVAFNKTFSLQTVFGYDFGISGDTTTQSGSATSQKVLDSFSRMRLQPRLFVNVGKNFHILGTGFAAWGDSLFVNPLAKAPAAGTAGPAPTPFFMWNVGAGLGIHF